jgi:hypothetical protein
MARRKKRKCRKCDELPKTITVNFSPLLDPCDDSFEPLAPGTILRFKPDGTGCVVVQSADMRYRDKGQERVN